MPSPPRGSQRPLSAAGQRRPGSRPKAHAENKPLRHRHRGQCEDACQPPDPACRQHLQHASQVPQWAHTRHTLIREEHGHACGPAGMPHPWHATAMTLRARVGWVRVEPTIPPPRISGFVSRLAVHGRKRGGEVHLLALGAVGAASAERAKPEPGSRRRPSAHSPAPVAPRRRLRCEILRSSFCTMHVRSALRNAYACGV